MRRTWQMALGGVLLTLGACDTARDPISPQQAPLSAEQLAPLHSAANGKKVDGSYVVVVKKDADPRSVAAIAGVTPRFVYEAAVNGFAAELNPGQLNALRQNRNVEYIEEDFEVQATATQSNPTWGLDRIDQRDLPLSSSYTYNYNGSGVTAYIIDTGILTSHTDFGGRAVHGYTAINDGRGSTDCNGHGTHVAGTVGGTTWGVAKGVKLVAVRVLDCNGSGTNSGVIAGMDWVVSNHSAGTPAVANMSLGGGASTATDDAVKRMHNDGVTVVVAAGNENQNACNVSPAREPVAVTVGSTTSSDSRSSFSNYGSCLDLFAPGSSIKSAWHTSTTATNTISGTSMASPHVAGAAALYLHQYPSASPATVANAIVSSATTGKVTSAGTNSPNRLLYSLFGGGDGGGGGDTTAPCTGCEEYGGTLSGTGDYDYHPNGNYYYSSKSGYHKGWLRGPSGTDFDLYLWKWNGSSWSVVAKSESSTSEESISYYGSSGYYVWRIYSYSGSGSYKFWMQRP